MLITNAIARIAYVLRGWKVIEQRKSIFILKKGSSLMMCHGFGTIYSLSNSDSYYSNSYWDLFIPLPGLYEKPRVLIIGLGGGTIARQLSAFYENADIEVVEIDRDIAELAQKHFPIGKAKVVIAEGAEYIRNAEAVYDLIILDAFVGTSVPESFSTVQFFSSAWHALSKNGILAINYMGDINPARGLAKDFSVYTLQSPLSAGNRIVICSKSLNSGSIKKRVSERDDISVDIIKAYGTLA